MFTRVSSFVNNVLQRVGDLTYHSGQTWKADPDYNSFENHVLGLTGASSSDANLHVYMCKDQPWGYVGIAYVGTLCKWKSYQCSINEKLNSIVQTSEVKELSCLSLSI